MWTLIFYYSCNNDLNECFVNDLQKFLTSKCKNIKIYAFFETNNGCFEFTSIDGNKTINISQHITLIDYIYNVKLSEKINNEKTYYGLYYGGHAQTTYINVNNEWLYTVELSKNINDIHFDIIILDACLMASLENSYVLRNNTDYIIAFQNECPAEGLLSYKLFELFDNINNSKIFIYRGLIDDFFVRQLSTDKQTDYYNISLIDCKYVNILYQYIKKINNLGDANIDYSLFLAFRVKSSYGYDLYHVIKNLIKFLPYDKNIKYILQKNFRDLLSKNVIYHKENNVKEYKHNGLSISRPFTIY
jgi:hypothetical protein